MTNGLKKKEKKKVKEQIERYDQEIARLEEMKKELMKNR